MNKLIVDTRPRCPSVGLLPTVEVQEIPCDLHMGHKGKHEWSTPMGTVTYVWTNKSRNSKAL